MMVSTPWGFLTVKSLFPSLSRSQVFCQQLVCLIDAILWFNIRAAGGKNLGVPTVDRDFTGKTFLHHVKCDCLLPSFRNIFCVNSLFLLVEDSFDETMNL